MIGQGKRALTFDYLIERLYLYLTFLFDSMHFLEFPYDDVILLGM